jgi:hypothetical protein
MDCTGIAAIITDVEAELEEVDERHAHVSNVVRVSNQVEGAVGVLVDGHVGPIRPDDVMGRGEELAAGGNIRHIRYEESCTGFLSAPASQTA